MDISKITEYLYVSAQPQDSDAIEIAKLGVRLIISMVGLARPPKIFAQPPLDLLWLPSYDSFLTPIARNHLMRGVRTASKIIQEGGCVLTFCQKGRHRSVIMAAAILIAQGYSAEAAIALIQSRRTTADPQMWYIRRQIYNFEKSWQAINLS